MYSCSGRGSLIRQTFKTIKKQINAWPMASQQQKPPYKGHLGTRHLVLYKEVVLSLEVQNVLSKYEVLHLGPLNLSFIKLWSFSIMSLYGVSIKRGSTIQHDMK